MKKLLLKAFVFILPMALLFGFVELQLSKISNSYVEKKRQIESGADNVRILVFGSSHARDGVDVSLWPVPAVNLANSGQDLYYDSRLLFKYLDRMPRLETVLVHISYFSLESDFSRMKESWRKMFYQRFFSIPPEDRPLDFRSFSLMAVYGRGKTLKILKQSLTNLFSGHKDMDNSPVGEAMNENISDESAAGVVEFFHSFMSSDRLATNTAYLETIIGRLSARGVRTVLFTCPAYETFRNHMDKTRYARQQAELNRLCGRFGVTYLNYLDDPRFTFGDFRDNHHLCPDGAKRLSAILYSDLSGEEVTVEERSPDAGK